MIEYHSVALLLQATKTGKKTDRCQRQIKLAILLTNAEIVNAYPIRSYITLHVASAPSLAVFRQRLKTFLFSRSYQDTIMTRVLLSPFITTV